MNHFKRGILMGCMFGLSALIWSGTASANVNYQVKPARNYNSRVISGSGHALWSQPYNRGVNKRGNVGKLSGQLMQIDEFARSKSRTYFKLSRKGVNYGWINASFLHKPATYVLPFTYNSQLYPTFAPNACEAVGLKMALSVKGAGMISTRSFINAMPRSNNPMYGFRGNPFAHNHSNPHVSWTIRPSALARFGRRYDSQTYDITGASRLQLISEVKHGNAVAFAAARNLSGTPTGHTLTIVGYKYGAFLIADPYKDRNDGHKIFWASTTRVMSYYNRCNKFAVVVR